MTLPTVAAQLFWEAAAAARLAPSIHNTQPWHFVIDASTLRIHADRDRQLRVADPDGRQLMISCGCAVFNARATLAARGYDAVVSRLPDRDDESLVARLQLPERQSDWVPIGVLEPQILRRRSNRSNFLDISVDAPVRYALADAARAEDAELFEVREQRHRLSIARLCQRADQLESTDSAYWQELTAWTTGDPRRKDGVPAMAVPYRTSSLDHISDALPIRDFDTHRMGWLDSADRSGAMECVLVLLTATDDPLAWLRAGEALQRLWLEATRTDYVLSLFSQVIDIADLRAQLRAALGTAGYPQMVLRVGRAGATAASSRRDLDELVTVELE